MNDRFTAQRVATLDTAIVEKLHLRHGAKGVTIPQLDDPRYRGKPVIVDYFGTWCPACMDETPFLVELYRRHHEAGLEILSIALESTTDDAYNQRQVEYFRKLYAIPWQIVVLPGDYADSEKLLPPELEGTGGYPVTIFLNRDRGVRGLHSGFFGPAAGEDNRLIKQTFERYVQAMLAAP
jgi:thiol-disulfide isomerase/thioredoxin